MAILRDVITGILNRRLDDSWLWRHTPGNVLRYGADPTGTVSSSAAFQAAIDQAGEGGASVFVPAGTYLLDVGLTTTDSKFFNMAGEHDRHSILKWTGGAGAMITLGVSTHCTFKNFRIDNTGSATVAIQVNSLFTIIENISSIPQTAFTAAFIRTRTDDAIESLTCRNIYLGGFTGQFTPIGILANQGNSIICEHVFTDNLPVGIQAGNDNGGGVQSGTIFSFASFGGQHQAVDAATDAVGIYIKHARGWTVRDSYFAFAAPSVAYADQLGVLVGAGRGGRVECCDLSGDGNQDYAIAIRGEPANITAITKANPGVVTTDGNNLFISGDRVRFAGVGGMTELNTGEYFTVTTINDSSFSIGVDTTSYGTYTSGGTATVDAIATTVENNHFHRIVLAGVHVTTGPQGRTRIGNNSLSSTVKMVVRTDNTFTPGMSFGNATTGITYGAVSGVFWRDGNMCDFQLTVTLTSKGSATGFARITRLPFLSDDATNNYVIFPVWASALASVSGQIQGLLNPNDDKILLEFTGTGAETVMTDAHLNNTSQLIVTGRYFIKDVSTQ